VIVLLSGGIDSPVAAHLMLKRGCAVEFLHFHMLRSEEEIREAKVVALARTVMAPHRLPAIVHMVPAHPFQLAMMTYNSRVDWSSSAASSCVSRSGWPLNDTRWPA
jgi:thiamine biosynthesis protein ThiI